MRLVLLDIKGIAGPSSFIFHVNIVRLPATSYPPSKLPTYTRELMECLHDAHVDASSWAFIAIDLRLLTLDQISANYIQEGISVLQEIEDALAQGRTVPRTHLQRL